jgi:metal-sulfur cluster biosynthetic enzyme
LAPIDNRITQDEAIHAKVVRRWPARWNRNVSVRRVSARIIATIALLALGIVIMVLPYLLRLRGPALSLRSLNTVVDSVLSRPGTPRPDSTQVSAALARVMDPELDVSVVDLGLIERQEVDSLGNVEVVMFLTTPECPYQFQLAAVAVSELKSVPGIRRIEVRLDPSAEWRPERMSDEGRKRFRRLFGDGRDTDR